MSLSASVSTYVVFIILVVAGRSHLLHRGALVSSLTQQKLWPQRIVAPIATTLIVVELGIGGLGLVSIVTGAADTRVAMTTAAAGLFAGFLTFSVFLRLRRPVAPCGCTFDLAPADSWVIARAAALTLGALVALSSDIQQIPLWPGWEHAAMLWGAILSFSILVWTLPRAMQAHDFSEGRDRFGF